MYTTEDILAAIRDQLREYRGETIDDAAIMRRVNMAYSYIYNTIIKINDSLFSSFFHLQIKPHVYKYKIPEIVHNKRIERLYYPVPLVSSYQPYHYTEIERVDVTRIHDYLTPAYPVNYPIRWTQQGDYILLAPPPRTSCVCKVMYTPARVPLARVQGQIVDIQGANIFLDRTPLEDLLLAYTEPGKNLISICDELTGEIKALYPVESVSGNVIKLGYSYNRDVVYGHKIIKVVSFNTVGEVTYDPDNRTLTARADSFGINNYIKPGDYIEVVQNYTGYVNIYDTLESMNNPYDPPEYYLDNGLFSRYCKVISVTDTTITWQDDAYVPNFVNGRPQGYPTGDFLVVDAYNMPYNGLNVVYVKSAVPHGFIQGKVVKAVFSDTGTNLDGVKKVLPINENTLVVYIPSLTGTLQPSARFRVVNYGTHTGVPRMQEVNYSLPQISLLSISCNTPPIKAYMQSIQHENDYVPPYHEAPENGPYKMLDTEVVKVGDYVSLGYSTCVPRMSDLVAEFIVMYAVIALRSALNEVDNKAEQIVKEKLMEVFSDNDGRRLNLQFDSMPYYGNERSRRGLR